MKRKLGKVTYNYLKYELESLDQNWEEVKKFTEGELLISTKRVLYILEIKKAAHKARKLKKEKHKIEIMARELGLIK